MKKKLAACLLSAAILCSGVTTAWAATPIETGFAGLCLFRNIYTIGLQGNSAIWR